MNIIDIQLSLTESTSGLVIVRRGLPILWSCVRIRSCTIRTIYVYYIPGLPNGHGKPREVTGMSMNLKTDVCLVHGKSLFEAQFNSFTTLV